MKLTLPLLSILLLSFAGYSQGKISGTLLTEKSSPAESVTVQLYNAANKKLVKTELTGSDGNFTFEKIGEGKYYLQVNMSGFKNFVSNEVVMNATFDEVKIPAINLQTQAKALAGVTIEAKKPFIEQKVDRTIVNVDASPSNAGATALEVLEKSPNVSVDNNGNISLKGKSGVIVMLDGKPTYLSPADLANILRNMPASALDQIEIMTNPSAKYDASGNSGLINIKTKKNKATGSNGNLSVGNTTSLFNHNGKTELTWKPSFTINYNYKKNKINLFTNFVYNHREGRSLLDLTRKYYRDEKQIDSLNKVNTYFKLRNNNFTLKLGMDYYADKKNVFGVVLNGFVFAGRPRPITHTTFATLDGNVFSRIDTRIYNELNWNNYGVNFNYKHAFDTTSRELTTDIDYAYYKNTSEQFLSTGFFNGGYQQTSDSLYLKGHLPSIINIYSIKSDYVQPFKSGLKLEAGIKASYVKSDNLVSYLRLFQDKWFDDSRNNHFLYDENINAAYVNLNEKIKKWSAQAGLRVENTNSKGYQVTNNSSFNRHYTNLFPSAFLSYEVDKKNLITASFSRRVQRPNYQDLNPFTFFLDSLSYRQGNPLLGPQFSYNYELSHTWGGKITTTINYTTTNKVISGIVKQQRGSNDEIITFLTTDNLANLVNKGIAISAPLQLYKWWNVNLSGNVYNNHYSGTFVTTENNVAKNYDINLKYTAFSLNVSNTFNLSKNWTAEISGWYNSKTIYQLMIAEPMGQLNFGLAKNNLLKGKASLKINARDPFGFQYFRGTVRYANVDEKVFNRWDGRSYGFTFSYRFGKGQFAQRKKAGGSQDEQNRVGAAGN